MRRHFRKCNPQRECSVQELRATSPKRLFRLVVKENIDLPRNRFAYTIPLFTV